MEVFKDYLSLDKIKPKIAYFVHLEWFDQSLGFRKDFTKWLCKRIDISITSVIVSLNYL